MEVKHIMALKLINKTPEHSDIIFSFYRRPVFFITDTDSVAVTAFKVALKSSKYRYTVKFFRENRVG